MASLKSYTPPATLSGLGLYVYCNIATAGAFALPLASNLNEPELFMFCVYVAAPAARADGESSEL